MDEAQAQLDGFLAKFLPEVAALARSLLAAMTARIPGAQVLVYDNYNALAIGFGPSAKAGQAVLSLAVFPRWVTLCFLQGVGLPDPYGLLKGGEPRPPRPPGDAGEARRSARPGADRRRARAGRAAVRPGRARPPHHKVDFGEAAAPAPG